MFYRTVECLVPAEKIGGGAQENCSILCTILFSNAGPGNLQFLPLKKENNFHSLLISIEKSSMTMAILCQDQVNCYGETIMEFAFIDRAFEYNNTWEVYLPSFSFNINREAKHSVIFLQEGNSEKTIFQPTEVKAPKPFI